jgi:branched-chain amino acid transport system permease protein
MSGYQQSILVIFALNIILAYAVWLPLSAGSLNLGIAAFSATGAYVAAYLTNTFGWSFLAASVTAVLISTVIALGIGLPVLRTKGVYFALATFALGQIAVAILLNLEVVGAAAGFPVQFYLASEYIYVAALLVVVAALLFGRSQTRILVANVKHDPLVAELFGINVPRYQLIAFASGAALAAFGGSLYAHHFSFLEPVYFNALFSIYAVLFALLGGTQSAWGPLVGAAFFTFAPEAFRFADEWRAVIFAALIILFMALRPEGIVTAAVSRGVARYLRSSIFQGNKA